jgi:hypothetical protein
VKEGKSADRDRYEHIPLSSLALAIATQTDGALTREKGRVTDEERAVGPEGRRERGGGKEEGEGKKARLRPFRLARFEFGRHRKFARRIVWTRL